MPNKDQNSNDSGGRKKAGGVAAVILAAGESRRSGDANKLLFEAGGAPLVRRVTEAALASRAAEVIAVTGHEADLITKALAGLDLRVVHNPDYRDGLSTSLKAGISAVPEGRSGVLVLLADMPRISAGIIDLLIGRFEEGGETDICAPVFDRRRGHPVLWPRRFFPQLLEVSGDAGGRDLLKRNAAGISAVEVDTADIHFDVDGPGDLWGD
ncbi:MAG: nucleotidyltransferase family protein [Proteobacteria bacterium]|nr:nucleotidyltransferase family protein [Pseudomonadota bacterium]